MGNKILVIGDLHIPVVHPGYLDFCRDLYKKWKCNTTVFIGDVLDWHAISMHPKEPECPGPKDEYLSAKIQVAKWYKAFPKAKVCIGNHDERPEILARSASIPAEFVKSYRSMWDTPGWEWLYDFILDETYFYHGTGQTGVHPSWCAAGKLLMSVVMGHCHSRAGIKWRVNPLRRIFAMDVGCGIDVKAYQFMYGRHCKERPVLSAGVIIDRTPYIEPMSISPGERYAKERYR